MDYPGSIKNGEIDTEYTVDVDPVNPPAFVIDASCWTDRVEDRLQALELRVAELSKRLAVATDIIDRQHQRILKLERAAG